jgi:hypothetical protein
LLFFLNFRKLKPTIFKRKIKISTKFDPKILEPSPEGVEITDKVEGWSFVAPAI